jgi:hypothetical protein
MVLKLPVVGNCVVLQHMPRAVMISPPFEEMYPPLYADVADIEDTDFVDIKVDIA